MVIEGERALIEASSAEGKRVSGRSRRNASRFERGDDLLGPLAIGARIGDANVGHLTPL
jgi:hypothetical protein